jgi:hypothetical protein
LSGGAKRLDAEVAGVSPNRADPARQREIGQMQAWRLSWGNGSMQAPLDPKPRSGGHEGPGEDMNH